MIKSVACSREEEVEPLRVGVMGCGTWGPQLIRNFSEMPEAVLVGVAEPRAGRLDYVRRQYPGVELFADHRSLIEMDLDAVVIATPIETHFPLARDAILAGKHVLVEKPLTANVADAVDLINLAHAHQRVLMTGHTFLYNPAVGELRRVVQSGELGRIYYVDTARLSLGQFQRRVNVIWDLAPHDVSILFHVLERRPTVVSARGSSFVQHNIHDVAYIEIQFEDGVSAQIHVSWLDPAKVRRITVVGDRKMAVYNDVSLAEKIRIYDKGVESPVTDSFGEFQLAYRHGEITIPYIPWKEPLRLECEHFVDCVRTGAIPRSDGFQGLAVVAVLEAANQSLAQEGVRVPINFPAPLDGEAIWASPNGWGRGLGGKTLVPQQGTQPEQVPLALPAGSSG